MQGDNHSNWPQIPGSKLDRKPSEDIKEVKEKADVAGSMNWMSR